MLLFIKRSQDLSGVQYLFQYISCYSLSTVRCSYNNIVYLFQYISCYSLSSERLCLCNYRNVSIHLMLLFIFVFGENFRIRKSFNTSHVTLYRKASMKITCFLSCFNTSHVTLYPSFYRLFFF